MSARILIVDDSLTIRRALEMILEPAGFELRLAASGKEALEIANAFDPELILLDYVLPDMRGPDVCSALEEIPRTQNTPVVLVSAKGTSIRQAYEDARNVVSYITKPFKPQVILSVVTHALSENRRVPAPKSVSLPTARPVPNRGSLQSVEVGFRNLLRSLEETASFASRRELDPGTSSIEALLKRTSEQLRAMESDRAIDSPGLWLNRRGELIDPGARLVAAHSALCQAGLLLARNHGQQMRAPVIPSRILVATAEQFEIQTEMAELPEGELAHWIVLDRRFEMLPHLAALLQPEIIVLQGPPTPTLTESLKRLPSDVRINCVGPAEHRDAIDIDLPHHESLEAMRADIGSGATSETANPLEVFEL